MVGITLSPEQIRAAQPMVREWLQHEINASLGLQSDLSIESPSHFVACTQQEAATIFSTVRSMLPVVNVFFELGRQGESINQQGVEAFRLDAMLHHARLTNIQELSSCLGLINQIFQHIRNDGLQHCMRSTPKDIALSWRPHSVASWLSGMKWLPHKATIWRAILEAR